MKRAAPSIVLALFSFFLFACQPQPESGTEQISPDTDKAYIENKGSDTLVNLALAWAEEYQKKNPNVQISVTGGGSGTGITALMNGTISIANASREIKPEEIETAEENGFEPIEFVVADDAIAVIINPKNPVDELTLEQVSKIYKGEIRNWKELGGEDRKIVVISRDTSSGTYEVWEKKVMKKERVFPGALLQASNGAVVQAVSKNKNAIGYIGLGYINESVKDLMVDRVKGSEETTLNGTFPISRPLYMFTSGWPKEDTLNFINFVVHPEKGQKYVKEAGFVPLY